MAMLSPRGEEGGGGGKEACGIPGRGEEDKDRGREVQGRVDEARRGREEEGGGSVGGRDPHGVPVPGVGGELGRGGRRRRLGTGGRPHGRCPPHRVSEGGVSPPAVDGDGSNECNRSY